MLLEINGRSELIRMHKDEPFLGFYEEFFFTLFVKGS